MNFSLALGRQLNPFSIVPASDAQVNELCVLLF
jgi:hypothetical protein